MPTAVAAGVIVVDKPAGWTSHDVVAKMRRLAQTKKIGHLGTLDPAATGVLPLLIGSATRLAQFYAGSGKSYEGVIEFGYATTTYDAEGTPTTPVTLPQLALAEILPYLNEFRGAFLQTPPPVSAKKVGGKPAYVLARQQKPVELAAVPVTVHEFSVLGFQERQLQFRLRCSAGTYVRSIAHDLGQRIGCGAFLRTLRRTVSGEFTLAHSRTLPELEKLSEAGELAEALIPARNLLPNFPTEMVAPEIVERIRHGREFVVMDGEAARHVKAVSTIGGELIAIAERLDAGLYHPVCVFV